MMRMILSGLYVGLAISGGLLIAIAGGGVGLWLVGAEAGFLIGLLVGFIPAAMWMGVWIRLDME